MPKHPCLQTAGWVLSFAVLGLFALPTSALANSVTVDGVTLTLNTTSLTVAEGSSITLDFTASNASGTDITAAGVAFSLGSTTGDSTDTIKSLLTSFGPPCVELAPVSGGSCDLKVTLATPSPADDTDSDSGITPLGISWEFFGPSPCTSTVGPGCILDFTTDITVVDSPTPPPTTTPEPSSVLLVASGLLAFCPAVRRRFRLG